MIPEQYAAITTLLAPLGVPVHVQDATGTLTYPYVLLWGLRGVPAVTALSGARGDLDERLGVTSVGATVAGCLVMQARVRAALDGAVPVVSGRVCDQLRLVDARAVDVDRDVSVPGTGHPAFAVDVYALSSQA